MSCRDHSITIRVTQDELASIKSSAEKAGMTRAGYIRLMSASVVDSKKNVYMREFARKAEVQCNNWILLIDDLYKFIRQEKKGLI